MGLIKAVYNGQGTLPVPVEGGDVGAVPVPGVPAFTVVTGLVA